MTNYNNKDFQYFVDNYSKLFKKYGHKFIVIKNQQVLGAYEDVGDAVKETLKTEELGTFIVQECTGNPSSYHCKVMRLCIS